LCCSGLIKPLHTDLYVMVSHLSLIIRGGVFK